MGDVNGDGAPDLAVANLSVNMVSVLLNMTVSGATTPVFTAPSTFSTATAPISVVFGDFNSDGKPDLAVANKGFGQRVGVVEHAAATNATTPHFRRAKTFAAGPQSVVRAP